MIRKSAYYFCFLTLICLGFQAQNIFTAVGGGTFGYSGDGGSAYLAKIYFPQGAISDISGNIYFADQGNSCIRRISPSGIITTIAGIGTSYGWSGDGGQATSAQLASPAELAFDALGNLYFTDDGCQCVRKINTSGIISTIAGNGGVGYTGDGGLATSASFDTPLGIVVDNSGNIFVSDWGNSCIRKINTSGIISTIAGNGTSGYSGDGGPAISALLWRPWGIALDALGNLYIADKTNERIRKINTSGIITTAVGTGIGGYNGDGIAATSAKIMAPSDMVFDSSNNLYFVERGGMRIRKVNATSGIISTVAGSGVNGNAGDGGPATLAQFNLPQGIALDANGNIYVTDAGNANIRIICNTNCLAGINDIENKNSFKIYPNPVSSNLFISNETSEFKNSEIEITNTLGQTVLKLSYQKEIDVLNLAEGCYVLKIITSDKQQFYSKFIKE